MHIDKQKVRGVLENRLAREAKGQADKKEREARFQEMEKGSVIFFGKTYSYVDASTYSSASPLYISRCCGEYEAESKIPGVGALDCVSCGESPQLAANVLERMLCALYDGVAKLKEDE